MLYDNKTLDNQDNKTLNNNALVNENDNASLHNNACLEAIPYEKALQQSGWGELQPIKATLLPVEPFDPTQVPLSLGSYISDVSDRQQSPIDFVSVATLCALAAVIGNGVRIAPKQHDDWKIVPNLWGAIVGESSIMKTPAMKAALKPLYSFQKEWYKEWRKKKKQQRIEEKLEELSKQEKENQAKKALKKSDTETARALLSEILSKDNADDDCLPRFIVNDVTLEKLGELLRENPRGLLMMRDEFTGFLANMERTEFQSERAFYLEAFNGDGQFTYDRIGRGTIYIPNVTLSMIGGIQPSRITPIIQAMHCGKNNDGLIQRFQMLVWPDVNQDWKLVDRAPNQKARQGYEAMFRSFLDKPL
ncbi:DUF3987 domain-containing protein, partial [Bartonella rattaustraliani]|uniref:DUF3987 domain-containing protein n=1 Tax=Bartonella rattaustraliani TaxID=481139 RepID=UPI0004775A8F